MPAILLDFLSEPALMQTGSEHGGADRWVEENGEFGQETPKAVPVSFGYAAMKSAWSAVSFGPQKTRGRSGCLARSLMPE